jgi:glycosyltransferase involved in cell wall biosynthesis
VIRVLHIAQGRAFGGVEAMLTSIARLEWQTPEVGHEFALCWNTRCADELQAAGARLHLLGEARVRNPLSLIRSRRALRNLLSRQHYDVVVCHLAWAHAVFGPTVEHANLPLVFWLHGDTTGRHWLERWGAMTTPDLAICSSKFVASALPAMFANVRAEVVNCPVPACRKPPTSHDRSLFRQETATSEEAVVIVHVGRLEAGKGQLLLLQSLARIRDTPHWTCWMVGGAQSGSEARFLGTLRSVTRELGLVDRVRFLGERHDVPGLLGAADIYCQPTIRPEGFGITFVEAMHAGLPVIATRLGAAPEILDESCAVLVPPKNAEQIAAALMRLSENPNLREEMGAAARHRADELFEPTRQLRKLGAVLSSIAIKDRVERDYQSRSASAPS